MSIYRLSVIIYALGNSVYYNIATFGISAIFNPQPNLCSVREMNKDEARAVLDAELERFRTMPYQELVGTVGGEVFTPERIGPSGEKYQLEIETFWENQSKKKVRVVGSADELPHKPIFWKIPVLRWIPIYVSSVTWTFSRDENGTDEK